MYVYRFRWRSQAAKWTKHPSSSTIQNLEKIVTHNSEASSGKDAKKEERTSRKDAKKQASASETGKT